MGAATSLESPSDLAPFCVIMCHFNILFSYVAFQQKRLAIPSA